MFEAMPGDGVLDVAYEGERVAVLNQPDATLAVGAMDEFLALVDGHGLAGHALKALYRRASEADVALREPTDDTSIMAFLVDATSGQYELADVAHRFLGEAPASAAPSLFDPNFRRTVVLVGEHGEEVLWR